MQHPAIWIELQVAGRRKSNYLHLKSRVPVLLSPKKRGMRPHINGEFPYLSR